MADKALEYVPLLAALMPLGPMAAPELNPVTIFPRFT